MSSDIPLKSPWGILGNSEAILQVVRVVEQVAPTDISVLIIGESGTGKEVVASAIHQGSKRHTQKIVTVNCGAIPEGLLESELFGHEKGAFTGAINRKRGYFEVADKGTLLLDEIGEMQPITQVKFLRVLEGKEFLRVGGTEPISTDTRIIAATNKDLEAGVRHGEIRKDLYYRLQAVTITVPPLRQRQEDIPLLANIFMERYADSSGIPNEGISGEAMEVLIQHNWPGNVRELKNTVESMMVLSRGKPITLDLLPDNILPQASSSSNLPVFVQKSPDQAEREVIYRTLLALGAELQEIKGMVQDLSQQSGIIFPEPPNQYNRPGMVDIEKELSEQTPSLEELERTAIYQALKRHNMHRRKAARDLGISERTLYRKLKEMAH
jgi:DNA-binding NtrC family response regulator